MLGFLGELGRLRLFGEFRILGGIGLAWLCGLSYEIARRLDVAGEERLYLVAVGSGDGFVGLAVAAGVAEE